MEKIHVYELKVIRVRKKRKYVVRSSELKSQIRSGVLKEIGIS